MFSPNYNFSFVSSVSCTLTDNFVVQKVFQEKKFQKNYFSWIFFLLLSFLSTPLSIFLPNFSKNWSFWKWFCVKERGPKNDFCILSSLLCTPTDKRTIQNYFTWKTFFLNTFFSEMKFFLHFSWNTSVINFTEPYKIRFSWNYFSVTKKIYLENCSYFFNIGILYSAW